MVLNAHIIIPHPYHQTGLLGNGKVKDGDIEYVLNKSHFLEIDNYKYGSVKNDVFREKYPNLKFLIGSDAHSVNNIGAYLNECVINSDERGNFMANLYTSEIIHLYSKKHTKLYWLFKKIKKRLFINLY